MVVRPLLEEPTTTIIGVARSLQYERGVNSGCFAVVASTPQPNRCLCCLQFVYVLGCKTNMDTDSLYCNTELLTPVFVEVYVPYSI